MSSSTVSKKNLLRLTKAAIAERAVEFERMYTATYADKQQLQTGIARAQHANAILQEETQKNLEHALTYQFLHLQSVQTSKIRNAALQDFRNLYDLKQQEVNLLVLVKDRLRALCKQPVSICPRCGAVETSGEALDVLCVHCVDMLEGFKNSE